MNASDDLLREQAYLVERGVRPLAWICAVSSDKESMEKTYERLTTVMYPSLAIPFVVPWKDGVFADVGFAEERWVVDMLEWAHSGDIPDVQLHRIICLLLGYSPKAIAERDVRMYAGDPSRWVSSRSSLSPSHPSPTPP